MAQEQDITEKSTPWLGIGAVLAAIGASVCCVGPLLLLSLGIGGAWMSTLTSFETAIPLFFALTLLLIWVGFLRLYMPEKDCNEGDVCADPKVQRKQRIIFWMGSMAILGLLSVPWIVSSSQTQAESMEQVHKQPIEQESTAANTQNVILNVQNMTCAMCPITIKKALDGIDGVVNVDVDFNRKTANIKFDPDKTNVEALINTTTKVGYPATIHPEK